MDFKVNLTTGKLRSKKKEGRSLKFLLRELKMKCDIYRLGLQTSFGTEPITLVRLNGNNNREKAPRCGYEVNLFGNDFGTKMDMVFGNLKMKLAAGGVGLLALTAFMGLTPGRANATQANTIPVAPQAGESIKPTTTVVPADVEAISQDAIILKQYRQSQYKLAYWHTNSGTHVNTHNNVPWANQQTHGNVNWDNRSYPHSNAWSNTPHSNLPPLSHTNVSGGTIPNDYLY